MGLNNSDIEAIMKDYVTTTNLIEDKNYNIINVGMMTYGRLISTIESNLKHQGTKSKNIVKTIEFAKNRLYKHIGIKFRPDISKVCVGTVNDILFISYVRSYLLTQSAK